MEENNCFTDGTLDLNSLIYTNLNTINLLAGFIIYMSQNSYKMPPKALHCIRELFYVTADIMEDWNADVEGR